MIFLDKKENNEVFYAKTATYSHFIILEKKRDSVYSNVIIYYILI